MKSFIDRYLPEELLRAFQAAYLAIRLVRAIQQL
jgi:hypothetical protein